MIDELKTFIAVVEQKSFTKAAKLVSLSQPSVSLHIANLENHFHTKLIDRSNKQKAIVITPTGKMLYNRAKQMSLILKDTEEELFNYHNSLSGTLKLGASMTIGEFLLPSILGAFVKEFPHIKIEVTIENTFHIYDRFKKHQLDIALVEGTVPVDNYRHGNFYKDTMVIVVSKDHPLAKDAVFSPKKSLAPQTWISREEGSGTRENLITFLNNAGIYPKNFMILGSNYAIKEAVRNNLGISFISSLVVSDAVKNNELAILPVAFPYTRDFLYMIHPEDTISKAALLFLNRLLHYTSLTV
jgi:DNA-binding transcriptional LysR family regulator